MVRGVNVKLTNYDFLRLQDQNSLNSNATPSAPYIFGSANLTVPSRFNFTGGNASPTFS